MGIVAVAAFGSAVLRLIVPIFHPGVVSILVGCGVLLLGMIRAMLTDGASRAYWFGFSAAGWLWLLSSLHVPLLIRYVEMIGDYSFYFDFDASQAVHAVTLTILFMVPTLLAARAGGSFAAWFFVTRHAIADESDGDKS
jgi:hypothetical protein